MQSVEVMIGMFCPVSFVLSFTLLHGWCIERSYLNSSMELFKNLVSLDLPTLFCPLYGWDIGGLG